MYGGYHEVDEGVGVESPLRPSHKVTYSTEGASLKEVMAREQRIAVESVEAGVRELAECQDSIAQLVRQDGLNLEETAKSIEKTHENIEKGAHQLSKAHTLKRKKRMCYTALVCLCIGVIVFVALGVTKKIFFF